MAECEMDDCTNDQEYLNGCSWCGRMVCDECFGIGGVCLDHPEYAEEDDA